MSSPLADAYGQLLTCRLLHHHRLIGTKFHDGHDVYVIESIPNVLISHAFYAQSMKLVKQMDTLAVDEMVGRTDCD